MNCSDLRVLVAIAKFNLKVFKSTVFLDYWTPVNWSKPKECDIACKFRSKKEKSWHEYRNFRRFRIGVKEDCSYVVASVGWWHSGINATLQRPKLNSTLSTGGPKNLNPPSIHDDEINDTIPMV
uniref:DUF7074 domain-containing protein n=1 Tax=Nelumbo nucifera TaxID=4432 RepID=A0A822Z8D7_NELNU|nr:TPA_asm: hypothetical protein HUJ06_015440 [Nelumbo nucifera]